MENEKMFDSVRTIKHFGRYRSLLQTVAHLKDSLTHLAGVMLCELGDLGCIIEIRVGQTGQRELAVGLPPGAKPDYWKQPENRDLVMAVEMMTDQILMQLAGAPEEDGEPAGPPASTEQSDQPTTEGEEVQVVETRAQAEARHPIVMRLSAKINALFKGGTVLTSLTRMVARDAKWKEANLNPPSMTTICNVKKDPLRAPKPGRTEWEVHMTDKKAAITLAILDDVFPEGSLATRQSRGRPSKEKIAKRSGKMAELV